MEEENQLAAKRENTHVAERMIRDSWLVRGSPIVLLALLFAAFKQNWIAVAMCAGLFCALPVVLGLSIKSRLRKNK
ncbi:MAG TPA: hypothetical protein VGF67_30005 [Ktedonobacteraceae bacterium]|jgi:cadmium resistance protein CadD (predicted permease)